MDNEQPVLVCAKAAKFKDRPGTQTGLCPGCDAEICWQDIDTAQNPDLVTAIKMCLDCAMGMAQRLPGDQIETAAPNGAREQWIEEGKSGEDFDRIHDSLNKAFKLRLKK